MLGASAPKTAMELGRLTLLTPLDSDASRILKLPVKLTA